MGVRRQRMTSVVPPYSTPARPHGVGVRTDDVGAEQAIRLRVCQELGQPACIAVASRTAVRRKRKRASLVFNAGCLQLLLGLTDARDLGRGVGDGWHSVLVDPWVAAGDPFDAPDAVQRGIVRKHWSRNNVADGVNSRNLCLEANLDRHASLQIERNTDPLQL